MKPRRTMIERPALDVLEDAINLLRQAPAGVILFYYIGAGPFVLGSLYFWADMSSGAFARDSVTELSFYLSIGFLWCKCWQAIFAVHLLAQVSNQPPPKWTPGMIMRVAAAQIAIQPSGLFVVPIAAVITLPFAAAYSFYQNVSILVLDRMGEPTGSTALRRESMEQARRWPKQDHIALAVLFLFTLVVFANILILVLALPSLLKSLFGIQTVFSRDLFSMLNTTLFASAAGLTYLCVDPIIKAFHVLRCFAGRSVATGDDLRVAFRLPAIRPLVLAAACFLVFCCGSHAALTRSSSPALSQKSARINQSISTVLARREFAWRAPREADDSNNRAANGFFDGIVNFIKKCSKPFVHAAERFGRWLGNKFFRGQMPPLDSPSSTGSGWLPALKFFAWIFCGIAVVSLGILGWRIWRHRREFTPVVAARPQSAVPDLEAENVTADQLAEDEWIDLAREMIQRGDLRLALRALYLAALAHLGQRQIISIARYKSNREYQRELQRRRPAESTLRDAFGNTVRMFERAWYGMHEVTADTLDASQANLEIIRRS